MKLPIRVFTLCVLITATGLPAFAVDVLLTRNDLWFDNDGKTKINAQIDLTHLSSDEVVKIIAKKYGGTVTSEKSKKGVKYYIQDSSLGNIKIAPRSLPDGADGTRISFKKLNHANALEAKAMTDVLKAAGASAPNPEFPLALRLLNTDNVNDFAMEVSGMDKPTYKDLMKSEDKSHGPKKPLMFRYTLQNKRVEKPEEFKEHIPNYKGSVVGSFPSNVRGAMPILPSESEGDALPSVVMHHRTFHDTSILGDFNPGIVNGSIAQALTADKYVESKFWDEYAPGALPKTHLLPEVIKGEKDPAKIFEMLNKFHPEGWVLKAVRESSSNLSILTDKTDVAKEVAAYKKSDFDAFRAKILKDFEGRDEDDINEALQKHKNYMGWKIEEYLSHPQDIIVQPRFRLDREFRVEVVGGKVIKGATVDRHYWWRLEELGEDVKPSSPKVIERVEKYTQKLVDKLPPELRGMPFAFDISTLKGSKDMIMIESNAGPESGFPQNLYSSIEALSKFLRKFPEAAKSGDVVAHGMTPEDQMKYLATMFKKWGIDPKEHYPASYHFNPDGLDVGFPATKVAKKYRVKAASCVADNVQAKTGTAAVEALGKP